MSLASISKNKEIIKQLQATIGSRRISHAYLFVGEANSRLQLGMEFAKAILCNQSEDDACDQCVICRKIDHGNHEDLCLIQKDENSVKVAAVEKMIGALSYKAIGSRTIVIIDDAHTMTIQAQNKLLKTLEEPSGSAVLILLSERKDALADTVLSRCVTYHLQESEYQEDAELTMLARQYLDLCATDSAFYKKRDLLEGIFADKGSCLEFLDVLEERLREVLLYNTRCKELFSDAEAMTFAQTMQSLGMTWTRHAIAMTEDCRKAIKQGYNVGYMLKQMCLRMKSEA